MKTTQRPYAIPYPEIAMFRVDLGSGIFKPYLYFGLVEPAARGRMPLPVAFESPYTSPETGERWLLRFVRLDIAQGAAEDAKRPTTYALTGVRPAPKPTPSQSFFGLLFSRPLRWLRQRLS